MGKRAGSEARVLSEEALRQIGTVDREQTERRIRRLFDRWSAGDVDAVIAEVAPDVAFTANGTWTGLTPPLRGREQVAKHLRKYSRAIENIVLLLHEIVIDGDRAVVHRTSVGRRRDDGRRYQVDFISFLRFRDGLVVEFSDYPDAAWSEVGAVT
jgi:ketosteroid isomerase-like protein